MQKPQRAQRWCQSGNHLFLSQVNVTDPGYPPELALPIIDVPELLHDLRHAPADGLRVVRDGIEVVGLVPEAPVDAGAASRRSGWSKHPTTLEGR